MTLGAIGGEHVGDVVGVVDAVEVVLVTGNTVGRRRDIAVRVTIGTIEPTVPALEGKGHRVVEDRLVPVDMGRRVTSRTISPEPGLAVIGLCRGIVFGHMAADAVDRQQGEFEALLAQMTRLAIRGCMGAQQRKQGLHVTRDHIAPVVEALRIVTRGTVRAQLAQVDIGVTARTARVRRDELEPGMTAHTFGGEVGSVQGEPGLAVIEARRRHIAPTLRVVTGLARQIERTVRVGGAVLGDCTSRTHRKQQDKHSSLHFGPLS